MKMKTIKCVDCGVEVEGPKQRKRCGACAKLIMKAASRRWTEKIARLAGRQVGIVICRDCGAEVQRTGPAQVRCISCSKRREKALRQTPEYKAYKNAYSQTPAHKAYQKARRQTSEYKAYKKAYSQTPEHKAYQKAYQKALRQTPEYKAYRKVYSQTPEHKAYQKAYGKAYKKAAYFDHYCKQALALGVLTPEQIVQLYQERNANGKRD